MIKIGGGLPRWAQLALCGAAGVLLIAGKHFLEFEHPWAKTAQEIVKDVGIALVVAAVIAATIDRWLSADLEQDVFEAVLGYIPPPEFRDEIRSVLRYSFMCRRHVMRVALDRLEGDCVRVTTTIERTLENITSRAAPAVVHLHVDEWGFDIEKTRIIDCYGVLEDGTRVTSDSVPGLTDSTIKYAAQAVNVAPKRTIKVHQKFVEIRRVNDDTSAHFGTPTVNPEIHVSVPDGMEYMISFGPSDPKIEREAYGHRQTLVGTYFPGQRMRVRWWPISTSNAMPA
jgi:hypothetical protein